MKKPSLYLLRMRLKIQGINVFKARNFEFKIRGFLFFGPDLASVWRSFVSDWGRIPHESTMKGASMEAVKTIQEVRKKVQAKKNEGKSIGLVTTMGFLHEGHLSLIKACRKENDYVIVSIFVNPTQFGPNEDLDSYPRDLKSDLKKCEQMGADLVFFPDPQEMYQDHKTYIKVEDLSSKLCGKTRPIHFRGVCTVCAKFFNITQADRAYYGWKDAQQLLILKKMVKDLNMNIELIGMPIVREEDGLAKSSRNKYLTPDLRKEASCLYRAILAGKKKIGLGVSAQKITKTMREVIENEPDSKIDYISVVDPNSLDEVETIQGPVLVAMAVYMADKARLIDNFRWDPQNPEA